MKGTQSVLISAAESFFEAGQWDEALAELGLAIRLPGPGETQIRAHGLMALIAGHRDDRVTAEEHLAAARGRAEGCSGDRVASSYLLLAHALKAERNGRLDEAVAMLAQILDMSFVPDMPCRHLVMPLLTRLSLAAGDRGLATAAGRVSAAQAADDEPNAVKTAIGDHCRGLLESDPDLLLIAAAAYRSASRPFSCAQALEEAVVLLAERGDLPGARDTFEKAAGEYQALGAEWNLRRLEARLRRFGIRRSRAGQRGKPAKGWGGLTPTEMKIARLVAEGRSNPEIAAELFLSRNTVQTHVSHILAKLGARSRAEIIRKTLLQAPPELRPFGSPGLAMGPAIDGPGAKHPYMR
jgi:DNA-binding CsgD family transcriptional regulator